MRHGRFTDSGYSNSRQGDGAGEAFCVLEAMKMKLVYILARDLKEWPNSYNGGQTEAVTQDSDGDLNTLDFGAKASFDQFGGSYWGGVMWTLLGSNVEIAEDYTSAIVTQSQWQAAVDALKTAGSDKAVERNGEDRPPIGSKCFALVKSQTGGTVWAEAEVVAHHPKSKMTAGVLWGEGNLLEWSSQFRVFKMEDQIAAEKREVEIEEIQRIACEGESKGIPYHVALYEAGYRRDAPSITILKGTV